MMYMLDGKLVLGGPQPCQEGECILRDVQCIRPGICGPKGLDNERDGGNNRRNNDQKSDKGRHGEQKGANER